MIHLLSISLLIVSLGHFTTAYANIFQHAQELQQKKLYRQALDAYKQGLAQNPDDLQAQFTYAYLCNMFGDVDNALASYNVILNKLPNNIQALYNTAYTLKAGGYTKEAIPLYERVIALQPDHAEARFGLARTHLQQGNFAQGWKLYEWYLKHIGRNAPRLRKLLKNNNLQGKTVLLSPEGGLGDTLQFVRYAETFHSMGGRTVVLAQKPLIPLLSRCPYINTLLPNGSSLPHYDAYVTMMNAPAVLCSTEETIPRAIPYLHPDPVLTSSWKEYCAHDTNFKVGICWQASAHNDSSRFPCARRSIPLKLLATVGKIDSISLYCLQQKEGLEQLEEVPQGCRIHTFDETFDVTHGAFMDTAALMKNLDLVITVDTALAHLAGGLGVPVWVLLPYSTDWRWITNRTDSPWYPTMKLFKQTTPFDWDQVMEQVRTELTALQDQRI